MEIAKKERITIFDITRFVAMLFMVQGHTVYAFLDTSTIDTNSIWWILWTFNRGFTAPVFLVVSGAVQIFANKRNDDGTLRKGIVKKRVLLGVALIIISYLMHMPGDISKMMNLSEDRLMIFYQVNILQLIGVCLIFSIFLLKYITDLKILFWVSLGIAIIFGSLGSFMAGLPFISSSHPLIFNYFSYNNNSYFPLFPNAAYYFFGICFGIYIKQSKIDYKEFLKFRTIIISVIFFLFYMLFHNYDLPFFKSILNINSKNISIVLFRLSIVFLYLFILTNINSLIKIPKIIIMFGKRALLVYIFHLYFIYNFLRYNSMFKGIFKLNTFDMNDTLLIVLLVSFLTFGSIYLIDLSLRKFKYSLKLYYVFIIIIVLNKLYTFL
jgi:uncharacterized membrane protein